MMRSALTVTTLLLLLASALLLRSRWPRLSPRLQHGLLAACVLLFVVKSLTDLTHWGPSASWIDDLLVWGRVVAYVFAVVLFTRLRPRALTIPIALVLLLPLPAASVYLPLEHLFSTASHRESSIGDHIVLETEPWHGSGGDNYGVDYIVARRAAAMPFLQRALRLGRLYRTQCDTDAISASISVAARQITLHCPPAEAGAPPLDEQIRLQ